MAEIFSTILIPVPSLWLCSSHAQCRLLGTQQTAHTPVKHRGRQCGLNKLCVSTPVPSSWRCSPRAGCYLLGARAATQGQKGCAAGLPRGRPSCVRACVCVRVCAACKTVCLLPTRLHTEVQQLGTQARGEEGGWMQLYVSCTRREGLQRNCWCSPLKSELTPLGGRGAMACCPSLLRGRPALLVSVATVASGNCSEPGYPVRASVLMNPAQPICSVSYSYRLPCYRLQKHPTACP